MEDKDPEIKCSFGVIIWHTNESFGDLLKTIESVKNVKYHKKNFGFVVCIKNKAASELGIQTFVTMMQDLKQKEFYAFLNVSHDEQNLEDQEQDCFMLIRQGTHLLKLTSGQEIDATLFSSINDMSDEELIKYPIFKRNDVTIIKRQLASSRYYEFENYDNMIQGVTENDKKSQETYVLNEN